MSRIKPDIKNNIEEKFDLESLPDSDSESESNSESDLESNSKSDSESESNSKSELELESDLDLESDKRKCKYENITKYKKLLRNCINTDTCKALPNHDDVYICNNFIIKLVNVVENDKVIEYENYKKLNSHMVLKKYIYVMPKLYKDEIGYAIIFENSCPLPTLYEVYERKLLLYNILFNNVMKNVRELFYELNINGYRFGDINLNNILCDVSNCNVYLIDLATLSKNKNNNMEGEYEIFDTFLIWTEEYNKTSNYNKIKNFFNQYKN